MARTARRGPENKKKHEASDWNSLKPQNQSQSTQKKKMLQSGSRNLFAGKNGRGGKKQRTEEEKLLHTVLHKEQRRERRREKRVKERQFKKVCFKCRLPGHKVEECIMNSSDQGTGICYKCGSTEHSSSACKVKLPDGTMPYASCYVCGKKGHISKACPDNPKGLYPLGGGCKTCGSVEHFQRDCAEFLEKKGIGSSKLKKISLEASVDAEEEDSEQKDQQELQTQPSTKKKKIKVIKF